LLSLFSTLKMEAIVSYFCGQHDCRINIPGGSIVYNHRCQDLKFDLLFVFAETVTWNGVHSASLSTTEELLDRKVAAPV
jgi:hypothetical protein